MSSTDVDWDAVSYITSSQYRLLVMRDLAEHGGSTPSAIAADTDYTIAHVSRALQELREEGMVELLVSEDRKKGRYYGLTDSGEATLSAVDEVSR